MAHMESPMLALCNVTTEKRHVSKKKKKMKGPIYLVTIAGKHFADKCNNEYYGIT